MSNSNVLRGLLEWFQAFIVAFVLALLINVFIFELYTVSGESMVPTFQEGNKVFAVKLHYLFKSEPNYHDVVIIDSRVDRLRTLKDEFLDNALVSKLLSNENKSMWIKRVLGKAGDTIEIKDGKLYRNNKLLDEPYINETMLQDFPKYTVPNGYVFVMGDNRNWSKDSREIGAVPLQNVRGKVIVRFWPINEFRSFFNSPKK